MTASLYTFNTISKVCNQRQILCIEHLELMSEKAYALLGPNGAGKTTLMRLLAFLDSPTAGVYTFCDQPVDDIAKFRHNAVWVPQSPVMFTGTVLYNVEYPMRLKGISRQLSREKAYDLLRQVNLFDLAKAPAHRLSGGETQRAAIARALATGARVLLFDEPTASVDARSRLEFIELMHKLTETGMFSIIIATHDIELAEAVCPLRVHLNNGRIVQ